MDYPYWKQQNLDKPLFPDLEWNKPQQKSLAGKLAIVGGNKLGFMATSNSQQIAQKYGIGEVKLLLPDALRPLIPKNLPDITYAPSTPSGSFSADGEIELKTIGEWTNATLFIGDSSKNSQTSLLFTNFIQNYEKPTAIARDAIDLLMPDMAQILEKDNITIIASFAQLQKIFRTTYYPKMVTFNMQLNVLVETLHKFTLTYPLTVVTYHAEKVIIAHDGKVVTSNIYQPMQLWSGEYAVKTACQLVWNPNKPLEAATSALI